MTRLRSLIAAVRLGWAVATAPDKATALCRLVDVDPACAQRLTVKVWRHRHLVVELTGEVL